MNFLDDPILTFKHRRTLRKIERDRIRLHAEIERMKDVDLAIYINARE